MSSGDRSIVWIDDDDATDPSLTGAKFAMLAAIRRWPEPLRPLVPDGFAVSTAAWRAVIEHNGLHRSPTIEQLRAVSMPPALNAGLETAASQLMLRTDGASWAVRSSSPLEDGPDTSYAGQFTSVLGVRGMESLAHAYRRCCASAVDAGVRAYQRRVGSPESSRAEMAVIVQAMVHDGEGVTGVVFSRHPGEPGAALIEVVRGSGRELGRTVPVRYVVRGDRTDRDVHGPADGPVDERIAAELARWAQVAQARVGSAVDVEFAIGRTGRVQILQLRPLTTSGGTARETPVAPSTAAVTGLAVGSGRVEGTVCRVDGPEQIDLLEHGCVLVTRSTDPSWLPLLGHVSAVVTDHGGLTSHAAIVCRELGLLAVVGCGDATSRLRHGERVAVTAASTGRGSVEQVDQR